MTLRFHDYSVQSLHQADSLAKLDASFLATLKTANEKLHSDLLTYRNQPQQFTDIARSELIIATGRVLENFLIDFFDIESAAGELNVQTLSHRPIFAFKKWYIARRAKRRLLRDEDLPPFAELNSWLVKQLPKTQDQEKALAEFALPLLEKPEANEAIIEKVTQWCIQAIKTPEGQQAVQGWASFKLPQKTDYKHLIKLTYVQNDSEQRQACPDDQLRQRDSFKLTDKRMTQREVMGEIDYCVYCHDHDGDFCSKGFPEKKTDPTQGYRTNPLGNQLVGCPLDEKISEMQSLKRDGYSLAALATIMIDNPMCPATGHRICNDCMKSCIYQKQTPVNIPEVETRILTDVINLPYGVEIYDLLTYWNPLRTNQHISKPYNGRKLFIAGLGPAGFTLAHHMLMEGFAVVASDGLKIEPLPIELLEQPIRFYHDIEEALDERVMAGFGGVAEYGITVRWDKNFLKLIYISLMRRPYFQAFGGVRLGGTVTIETLWELGFDHASIAVGAGLPKALPIPGSMAKGMRQANDFLMALQLTGAAKYDSLANLQIRLPAVVIGGGLTGVDTATELQAYYIIQVEKALARYEALTAKQGESKVRAAYDEEGLTILDEFLAHGKAIRDERARAKAANEQPNFIKLIRSWGGVTIVYRRSIQESPAYTSNHEELDKAFEEGIYYLEGLQPHTAKLDQHGHVHELSCQRRQQDEDGNWFNTEEYINLASKSILVATGAQPNIAYTFEHPKTFKRNGLQYQPYEVINDELTIVKAAKNLKEKQFGPFTSYDEQGKHVSFLGDTHPVFHGNVVSAIASALRSYPKITSLFTGDATNSTNDYKTFKQAIQNEFTTVITDIERRSNNIVELTVKAPAAVKRFKPGQFFRLQNYETQAQVVKDTRLQTEPMALAGFSPDLKAGTIKFMVIEQGASSKMARYFKPGESIALMGPTGVRSKIPEDQQTILILCDSQQGLAYARAVGPELQAAGNRVIFFAKFARADELFCQQEIESCTDQCFWLTADNSIITPNRDQDYSLPNAMAIDALINLTLVEKTLLLHEVDRITLIGSTQMMREFQAARHGILQQHFKENVKTYAAIYSTMQCMLKGVCAQCLQWQLDPETGERRKAVFACSWQDQPLELVDLGNFDERLAQNRVAETLANQWLDYTTA